LDRKDNKHGGTWEGGRKKDNYKYYIQNKEPGGASDQRQWDVVESDIGKNIG